MRTTQIMFVLLCFVLKVTAAELRSAEERTLGNVLAAPALLHAGESPIDVGGFAAPFFSDIDNDGKRDLLVGQLEHGRLRIYPNVGTNEQPKFDSFEWFRAGGRIAGIPSGCRVGFTPQVVDYDGDGLSDIVTGSFNGAVLYVFRRQHDGTFAEAEVLEDKFGNVTFLDSRYNSTLFVHDWDSNGALDLITGRRAAWVRNEGTTAKPIYGQQVSFLDKQQRMPYGAPVVADWDGDGLHDLLIAGRDVVWYRNVGEQRNPILDSPKVLISNADSRYLFESEDEVKRDWPAMTYSICVTDFDNDGLSDILLGDWYTTKRDFTNEQSEALRPQRALRSKFARGYHRLMKESPKGESRLERITSFRNSLREWDELASTQFDGPQAAGHRLVRHGGVWFFRRLEE